MQEIELKEKEIAIIEKVVSTVCAIGRDKHFNQKFDMAFINTCYTNGADKMVILPKELENWVIKFGISINDNEMCMREVENYQKAVQEGYDMYLAPCYFYTKKNGFVFTIQRKCKCEECRYDDMFYEATASNYDKADFETEDDYYEAVNAATDDCDDYDRTMAVFDNKELYWWLQDNNINDLHCGNFGLLDEVDVIVDYSGYCG
jgi:hypothetical protein